jgi:hypothetical protein
MFGCAGHVVFTMPLAVAGGRTAAACTRPSIQFLNYNDNGEFFLDFFRASVGGLEKRACELEVLCKQ